MGDERQTVSRKEPPRLASSGTRPAELPLPTPRCVIFDVDRTLVEPGAAFSPEGYVATGERFDLALDPARWREGQAEALAAYRASYQANELAHDDDVFERFAEIVVRAMADPGADAQAVRDCAAAVLDAWNTYENFSLYPDVTPCLERLHAAGLRIALLSNTNRDLQAIVAHFALSRLVDATVTSAQIGHVKPSPRIFVAVLDVLHAGADETVMVGDSYEEDVRGALAAGLGAILLDRHSRAPLGCPTITSLLELPAALGL
ncbi:MAG TPA: HAD family hydrolase [Thermoleophilia bacterium]|nr:HAD family hydrolase [Thermoleophilia bacterium]